MEILHNWRRKGRPAAARPALVVEVQYVRAGRLRRRPALFRNRLCPHARRSPGCTFKSQYGTGSRIPELDPLRYIEIAGIRTAGGESTRSPRCASREASDARANHRPATRNASPFHENLKRHLRSRDSKQSRPPPREVRPQLSHASSWAFRNASTALSEMPSFAPSARDCT